MTDFLVSKFVKDYKEINDTKVRERYGLFSSVVGIVCNVILFIAKFLIGTIANSISIISDGFNNLSDCATCVITMFGYKLSGKPADKDHPFGHGRMEYLTSLALAMMIIVVGVELVKGSIDKLLHPSDLTFSYVALIVLILSILIKLWMFAFNNKLGKRISSGVMKATAKDSLNDCIATSATLVSLVAACFTDLPIDGVMGIIVSVLIIMTGIEIIKETVDELLGKPVDEEIVAALKEIVDECEVSLGMHDLIVHDYGPGNLIGSLHVEVDSRRNIMDIHDYIDNLERDIYEKLGIMMTIHMDPVEMDNEVLNAYKAFIKDILAELNEEFNEELDGNLSMHDFRMVPGKTHTNLIFDVLIPGGSKLKSDYIEKIMKKKAARHEGELHLLITFDREFC